MADDEDLFRRNIEVASQHNFSISGMASSGCSRPRGEAKNLADIRFVKGPCFLKGRILWYRCLPKVIMGFKSYGVTSHKIMGLTKFRVINILARKERQKHSPICD